MRLPHPFIQLPLSFDAARLAAEVSAIEEAQWMPHPQGFPGNSMLPLIAVDGDPANESFAGNMRPTPHLERCAYLWQSLASLGATLGRTRLMRLAGHAEVTRHADQGYYWVDRVRVHIPIVTQPTVQFECGDASVNMAAGECWIFDTWRLHRVVNANDDQRIHLVSDTVGGEKFWDYVAAGRINARKPNWKAEPVAFVENAPRPELNLESVNVPKVMSPWEIESHLAFLFSEAAAHPAMPALEMVGATFVRDWRALWAAYGDSGRGLIHYQRRLDTFMRDLHGPANQVTLPGNELNLYKVVGIIVARMAVPPPQMALQATAEEVADRA